MFVPPNPRDCLPPPSPLPERPPPLPRPPGQFLRACARWYLGLSPVGRMLAVFGAIGTVCLVLAITWVPGRMAHSGGLLGFIDAIAQDQSQYEAYIAHFRFIGRIGHPDNLNPNGRYAPISAAKMTKYSRDTWGILGWFDDYGPNSTPIYDNLPLLELETKPELGRRRYRRYYTIEITYDPGLNPPNSLECWRVSDAPRIVKEEYVGESPGGIKRDRSNLTV